MDNCEHVAEVARTIVSRLSRSCPSLSILSTSREVLGVAGEQVIPLAPLALVPAAELFRERAAAAGGEVDAGGEQRTAVEEICRGWKDCRWPSSWRRPVSARWGPRKSPRDSATP